VKRLKPKRKLQETDDSVATESRSSPSIFDAQKEVSKSGLLETSLSAPPLRPSSFPTFSEDSLDEDAEKAKELLEEAARQTDSLDIDGELEDLVASKSAPNFSGMTWLCLF